MITSLSLQDVPFDGAFPGLKTSADASSLFGLNLSKPLASALAG